MRIRLQYDLIFASLSWSEDFLTSKEIDAATMPTSAPRMATSRQRAIWAGHPFPLILGSVIDKKIVEERSKSTIIVFTTEQEKLFGICRGANESGGSASRRRITDTFRDLQKLLLLDEWV